MPIAAYVEMIAKPGGEEELFERFTDIIRDVRTEPGNLFAVVMRDPEEPGKLYEFVIYRDQQAIEEHRAAKHSLEKGPRIQELVELPYSVRLFETLDWP